MTPTSGWSWSFLPPSFEAQRDTLPDDYSAYTLGTSPEYLRALGVRLVEGRWLNEADVAGRSRAVLVNKAWARRLSPNASPVGMTVATRGRRNTLNAWEIVGVVDDIRLRMDTTARSNPLADLPVAAFVDLGQQLAVTTDGNLDGWKGEDVDYLIGEQGLTFAVRTTGSALNMTALRAVVSDVDPRLAIEGLSTMGDVVSGIIGRQRFYAVVVTFFGAVAAIIAVIGIYGVFAYAMTQRTQEFGVRLALGAESHQVLALAMRHSIVLIAVGMAVGLTGAAAVTRYIDAMLAGVTTLDARTYAAVAIAFTAAALLASLVPARRATRISPLVALRHE
jgi:hypothetical protein